MMHEIHNQPLEQDIYEQDRWYRCYISMSKYLDKEDHSVLDLCAGNMYFRKFLPNDVQYYSAMNDKYSFERVVNDFNKGKFLSLKTDVIVSAGILEFIKEPKFFLDNIIFSCRKVIMSYCGSERNGTSVLSTDDVIKYFAENGFAITHRNNVTEDGWTLIACFDKMVPLKLKENLMCTGCGACVNTCPKDAITMRYDEEGFLKPNIDTALCIDCDKCVSVCPTIGFEEKVDLNERYYAAWASDDIRRNSSSGGAFSVIAAYVIKNGGYTFGATWTSDFFCQHIGINKESDLEKLRFSKYVQSDTKKTFREVKKLLSQEVSVVYFGCPCQIAGLKAYLGNNKDSKHLLTVDLICFCSPALIPFRKYLEENYGIDNVQNVTFREKTVAGWSPFGYKIEKKDGTILYPDFTIDAYQRAFHNVLARNYVCENCQYTDFPRQGDLSLGDFWGIEIHDKTWNDGKGTSLIIANTEKGNIFINNIQKNFQRFEEVPCDWAWNKGNRIANDGRGGGGVKHQYFLRLLKTRSFNNAVQEALCNHHDIGLVCFMNHNIGNNLTNYALYQMLTDLNYTVLMISQPADCIVEYKNKLKLFLLNPYPASDISKEYKNKYELSELNDDCSFFVLGSDQLLRDRFISGTNYYTCMDWVSSEKYKITYGTSFGVDYFEEGNSDISKVKYLFNRIQKMSVREASGVSILQEKFKIKAERVMDPIFLCNKKYYEQMAVDGGIRLPNIPYIGAYILDVTQESDDLVCSLANDVTNGEHLVIMDTEIHYNGESEGKSQTLPFPKVEEWIALIKNCHFFITDSFHGVCFALIFNKPFCVILNQNNWRGCTRILSLLKIVNLQERAVKSYDELIDKGLYKKRIDFPKVNQIIEIEKSRSKKWLLDALEERKKFNKFKNLYDFQWDQEKQLHILEEKITVEKYRIRNDLFIQDKKHMVRIPSEGQEISSMDIIGWGAGGCFHRNYQRIQKFYQLKWVCDINPAMWDREIMDGVTCISPQKLKDMGEVIVIIMLDNAASALSVINQLMKMGVYRFDHVENWLKYVESGEKDSGN